MKIRFSGKFEYKQPDDSWTHDTFFGRRESKALYNVRVNKDHTKFITKNGEEIDTFVGWLNFSLDGSKFNLPSDQYFPITAPYQSLNDKMQPTEFSLELE